MLGAREKNFSNQETIFCKQSKIIMPDSQASETQDEWQAMFDCIVYCKIGCTKVKEIHVFVWFINECVLIYIFLNFFGKINAYLAGHD